MNNKEIKVKVNITGGTFKGLQGCIDEITEDIVKVEITMFGRRCTYNVPKEYCEYDPAEFKAVEEEMEKDRVEKTQNLVISEIQDAWREVEDSIGEGLYVEKNITPAEAFQHMEKFRKELIENFSEECSEVGLDCSAIVGELKNVFAINEKENTAEVIEDIEITWDATSCCVYVDLYEGDITLDEAFQSMEQLRKELIAKYSEEYSAIVSELKNTFTIDNHAELYGEKSHVYHHGYTDRGA